MMPPPEETEDIFAESEADPGTVKLLKTLASLAFTLCALLPFASDFAQQLQLEFAFGKKLDITIAAHTDRLRGEFVMSRDPLDAVVEKASGEDGRAGGSGDGTEPLTFFARVDFVYKRFSTWLRAPTSEGSAFQNQMIFGSLVGFIGFLIAARVFGLSRVSAFLSGLFGPDRLKKIVIDLFFLKGIEREIFPNIRTSDTRKTVLATTSLNRVELHDLMRVTVGMQGDGSVQCFRETLTVEGRSAYAFCPSATGSGGDYYFNLTKVMTRSVKLSGDVLISAGGHKGHVGRLRFAITGFKATAWE